jgi:hypothetical protein
MWVENTELAGTWKTVWATPSLSTAGLFHEAVWQVNSDAVDVRITANGVVVLEGNLDSLAQDYGLSFNYDTQGFPLYEFAPTKWRLKPPQPWRIDPDKELKIEMKKNGGNNKTLVRGISVWGEP